MILSKLFTHMCLCLPSRINWYWRKLGANVGKGKTETKPLSLSCPVSVKASPVGIGARGSMMGRICGRGVWKCERVEVMDGESGDDEAGEPTGEWNKNSINENY